MAVVVEKIIGIHNLPRGQYSPNAWVAIDKGTGNKRILASEIFNSGIKESDLGNIVAEVYDPTHTYKYPNTCIYEKVLYRCDSPTDITGTWDSSKWTAIKSMDVFSGSAPGLVPMATASDADKALRGDGTWGDVSSGIKESDLGNIVAEVYDPTHTYKYPNTCIYEKVLYRCDSPTDITGTWDSSKWTAIKSMDVFSGSAPGLVPSAAASDADKALRGDGTWGDVSSVSVSYDAVNEELHLDFSAGGN